MNPEVPPVQPIFPKTCPWAIASLAVGAASFCVPVVGSIVAIVFGIVALCRIKSAAGQLSGHGLAITGIALGCASFALVFLGALALLFSRSAPSRPLGLQ